MSLLSLCALLFHQSHLFLICVVLTNNDFKKCSTRIRLDPLGCLVMHHHGKSMIVSRFTPLTENLLILCDPVTQMLLSRVFCKKTLLFSSSRDHNLGPSEKCVYTLCLPGPCWTFILAAPLEVHEMTWKCHDFLALSLTKALLKYFHQPNKLSLVACGQSDNSWDISFYFTLLIFILLSVSVDSCNESPRSSSLVLPLLSGTGFSVYLLTSESGDEEVSEGVVEEELADKPETTNGKEGYIASNVLALFCDMWFSTAHPVVSVPMILGEFRQQKNWWSFFKKHNFHK